MILGNHKMLELVLANISMNDWDRLISGLYHRADSNTKSLSILLGQVGLDQLCIQTNRELAQVLKKYVNLPELFTYLWAACYNNSPGFQFNDMGNILQNLLSDPNLKRLIVFCHAVDEQPNKKLIEVITNILIPEHQLPPEFRFLPTEYRAHPRSQLSAAVSEYMINRKLLKCPKTTKFLNLSLITILTEAKSPFNFDTKSDIPAEFYKS